MDLICVTLLVAFMAAVALLASRAGIGGPSRPDTHERH